MRYTEAGWELDDYDVEHGHDCIIHVGPHIGGPVLLEDGSPYDLTPDWVSCPTAHHDELLARIEAMHAARLGLTPSTQ